jgi:hypothetical protein
MGLAFLLMGRKRAGSPSSEGAFSDTGEHEKNDKVDKQMGF